MEDYTDYARYEDFDLDGEAHKKADEEIRQVMADYLLKIILPEWRNSSAGS